MLKNKGKVNNRYVTARIFAEKHGDRLTKGVTFLFHFCKLLLKRLSEFQENTWMIRGLVKPSSARYPSFQIHEGRRPHLPLLRRRTGRATRWHLEKWFRRKNQGGEIFEVDVVWDWHGEFDPGTSWPGPREAQLTQPAHYLAWRQQQQQQPVYFSTRSQGHGERERSHTESMWLPRGIM
jgi:hypothetical protein